MPSVDSHQFRLEYELVNGLASFVDRLVNDYHAWNFAELDYHLWQITKFSIGLQAPRLVVGCSSIFTISRMDLCGHHSKLCRIWIAVAGCYF